jgi:hypothetical protein
MRYRPGWWKRALPLEPERRLEEPIRRLRWFTNCGSPAFTRLWNLQLEIERCAPPLSADLLEELDQFRGDLELCKSCS